jgi:hypothetical protein
LLLAALLLSAASAAASAVWSDVVIAVTYNVSTVPYRPINAPEYVYYLPDFRSYIDPHKGLAVAEMSYGYFNFMAVPSLLYLRGLIYAWHSYVPYEVRVGLLAPGHLVGGSNFTVNNRPAEFFSICRGRYLEPWAFWIRTPGNYTVRSEGGMLRFIDEGTCAIYAVVELVGWFSSPNYTTPRAPITALFMLTGRQGDIEGAWRPFTLPVSTWINGTAHLYKINPAFYTVADGWYIANRTQVAAVAAVYSAAHPFGPVHFSALDKTPIAWPYPVSWLMFTTIGADPGDGAVVIQLPSAFYGSAEVGYVANETAGYFRVRSEWMPTSQQAYWTGRRLVFYLQRYGLAEVTAADVMYVWNTRAMACPLYINMTAEPPPEFEFIRLDRGRELELCNNSTSTLYVGLFQKISGRYVFVDELKRGKCVRLRYDGAYNASDTAMRFFTTPQDYCMQNAAFTIDGSGYTYGYRWFLMPDGSLVRGPPISPDALFEEMWRRLLQAMAGQLNATLHHWQQLQQNLTKVIENYYRSLPQYQGTIRIESSTSVWLQTVYNVIRSYTVSMPGGGGFAPVTAPAVPLAVAPAAAAAVAVAWAASRRDDDVVTTAAVAGIALAIFGLLMTLIYGASSLPLVALGIIVAAAAAAWRRL